MATASVLSGGKEIMKSCLVVDDSAVVRKVVRRILEELGFACREGGDGQEALEECTQAMPDCILLDWNMPVMDGIDILRALRGMPGGGHPKVVFCTTQNDISYIQEALVAGANEYIMKPFDKEILQSKFEQIGLVEPQI